MGIRIASSTAADHIACHQHGDEFAVIYRGLDLQRASREAEALLTATADIDLPKELRDVLPEGKLTFSIGLAQWDDNTQSVENLIMNADLTMGRAKDAGRNRTTAYTSVQSD